jgi:hypothetical protein
MTFPSVSGRKISYTVLAFINSPFCIDKQTVFVLLQILDYYLYVSGGLGRLVEDSLAYLVLLRFSSLS